jgi:hypothetical protein
MTSMTQSCGCGCSPCCCTPPSTFGCVTDMCVPRPCFFAGQLIGPDDLNAMVTYFRTREAMLARFVGGWGVLGGMRLGPGMGVPSEPLTALQSQLGLGALSSNPQIMPGTVAQVSSGAGIDASGRLLTLCSARTVDLAALAAETPVAPKTQTCTEWFAPLRLADESLKTLTAKAYWLVAQFVENPSRPVPQFTGGGACDPAPGCDFSRRIEDVQLKLVPLPAPTQAAQYLLTGCLDAMTSTALADLKGSAFGFEGLLDLPGAVNRISTFEQRTLIDPCLYATYLLADAFNESLANLCCTTPALVLGEVLFTSTADIVKGSGKLPSAATYTILMDAYPYRRVITSAATQLTIAAGIACDAGKGLGTVVAAGIVGSKGPPDNQYKGTPIFPSPPQTPPLTVLVAGAGLIAVSFAGYTDPTKQPSTFTYIVKALVVTPAKSDVDAYVVEMVEFQSGGIILKVLYWDARAKEMAIVPQQDLDALYFAIEISQYPAQP